MASEALRLSSDSLSNLVSLRGKTVISIGSPAQDFNDTWISGWFPIFLSVSGGDFIFHVELEDCSIKSVAEELPRLHIFDDSAVEFEHEGNEFPMYHFWESEVIQDLFVIRDRYEFTLHDETSEIVMDRGIGMITNNRVITIAAAYAHDDGALLLAHEPTVAGRVGVITQPAVLDLTWIEGLQHTRQLLAIDEVLS